MLLKVGITAFLFLLLGMSQHYYLKPLGYGFDADDQKLSGKPSWQDMQLRTFLYGLSYTLLFRLISWLW